MSETGSSNAQLCGKCRLPIHPGDVVRHCGAYVTHTHGRCVTLLRAEVDRLRQEVSSVAIENVGLRGERARIEPRAVDFAESEKFVNEQFPLLWSFSDHDGNPMQQEAIALLAMAKNLRAQALAASPQPPGADTADAARYRWLRGRVLGSEYRRLGFIYSEVSEIDAQIDRILACSGSTKVEG